MAFALELTRAASQSLPLEEKHIVNEWLDSIASRSVDDWGYGPWDVQLIRWDGEQVSMFESHRIDGREHWWTPPIPPPAFLMRYASRVRAS